MTSQASSRETISTSTCPMTTYPRLQDAVTVPPGAIVQCTSRKGSGTEPTSAKGTTPEIEAWWLTPSLILLFPRRAGKPKGITRLFPLKILSLDLLNGDVLPCLKIQVGSSGIPQTENSPEPESILGPHISLIAEGDDTHVVRDCDAGIQLSQGACWG